MVFRVDQDNTSKDFALSPKRCFKSVSLNEETVCSESESESSS